MFELLPVEERRAKLWPIAESIGNERAKLVFRTLTKETLEYLPKKWRKDPKNPENPRHPLARLNNLELYEMIVKNPDKLMAQFRNGWYLFDIESVVHSLFKDGRFGAPKGRLAKFTKKNVFEAITSVEEKRNTRDRLLSPFGLEWFYGTKTASLIEGLDHHLLLLDKMLQFDEVRHDPLMCREMLAYRKPSELRGVFNTQLTDMVVEACKQDMTDKGVMIPPRWLNCPTHEYTNT